MKEIFDTKQDMITFCDLKQAYVRVNEEEVEVNVYDSMGQENSEPTKETKYTYDVMLVKVAKPTVDSVVASVRSAKVAKIREYDSSDKVNTFSFSGVDMWLDKETRNGLVMRLNAEKSAGKETTTLWFGTRSFSIGVDEAIVMLSQLEVYASECYDNTASHIAAVSALDDVEEIFNYDYKVGYPQRIVF